MGNENNLLTVSPAIFKRLSELAQYQELSVEALLEQWLDASQEQSVTSYDTDTMKSVREAHHRYRSLFEQSNDAVFILDLEGRHLDVNRRASDMFGYTHDELMSVSYRELVVSDEHHRSSDVIDRLLAGEQVSIYERTMRHKDGHLLDIEVNPQLVRDENGAPLYLQSILRDITGRKKTHEALQRTEAQYRSIVEDTPLMMCRFLPDGEILFVNHAYCEFFKRSFEELVGSNFLMLLPESERDGVMAAISKLTIESPVQVTEHPVVAPDGSIRWQRWIDRALFDTEGKPLIFQSIGEDITERREAERLLREHERIQVSFKKEQEKNILIQQVISALSHDLKNPLAIISTSRDMLDRYFDDLSPESRKEKLNTIRNQVLFAIKLLDDTVQMVRSNLSKREFQAEPTSLQSLCEVSIEEVGLAYDTGHKLQFVNKSGITMVTVDATLVSRILLNLLGNAIKYSPAGSDIILELDQTPENAVIHVIDHGMGIPESDLPHIFDPFYRTDDVHDIDGTGQGLSIAKDCVERHGGKIRVKSAVGKGTTFTVELPL